MSEDTNGRALGGHGALPALLRRDQFLEALEAAAARARRAGGSYALCLIDVDRMRNINDRHGQAAGDAVLRALHGRVAAALALPRWRVLATALARFDGDSLILMLEGAGLAQIERLGEELRRRIAGKAFAWKLTVTASVAVAADRPGESVDALLARTEKTLYLAKQFGGDRVEAARAPQPRPSRASVTDIAQARRASPQ